MCRHRCLRLTREGDPDRDIAGRDEQPGQQATPNRLDTCQRCGTRAPDPEVVSAARAVALAYPTVADAQRAGYRVVGGSFGPGAGANYIGFGTR
jgi:hypothetical protein